jgi:hypothetical protein
MDAADAPQADVFPSPRCCLQVCDSTDESDGGGDSTSPTGRRSLRDARPAAAVTLRASHGGKQVVLQQVMLGLTAPPGLLLDSRPGSWSLLQHVPSAASVGGAARRPSMRLTAAPATMCMAAHMAALPVHCTARVVSCLDASATAPCMAPVQVMLPLAAFAQVRAMLQGISSSSMSLHSPPLAAHTAVPSMAIPQPLCCGGTQAVPAVLGLPHHIMLDTTCTRPSLGEIFADALVGKPPQHQVPYLLLRIWFSSNLQLLWPCSLNRAPPPPPFLRLRLDGLSAGGGMC